MDDSRLEAEPTFLSCSWIGWINARLHTNQLKLKHLLNPPTHQPTHIHVEKKGPEQGGVGEADGPHRPGVAPLLARQAARHGQRTPALGRHQVGGDIYL